ncbi:hypothetical protein C6P45_001539 [Maudiozyma exigua]|uniref:Uncharacterized protein n=1 Tax=Maudiozyma exigua TaxID=34358 RepID=A0A9P6W2W2_MAUEX|nr:hypothetical protein C6P45_001539 [Kazachstania exigua]
MEAGKRKQKTPLVRKSQRPNSKQKNKNDYKRITTNERHEYIVKASGEEELNRSLDNIINRDEINNALPEKELKRIEVGNRELDKALDQIINERDGYNDKEKIELRQIIDNEIQTVEINEKKEKILRNKINKPDLPVKFSSRGRRLYPSKKMKDYINQGNNRYENNVYLVANSIFATNPYFTGYSKCYDKECYIKAILDEHKSFKKMDVYEIYNDDLKNIKPIPIKVIVNQKVDAEGNILKHKVRF